MSDVSKLLLRVAQLERAMRAIWWTTSDPTVSDIVSSTIGEAHPSVRGPRVVERHADAELRERAEKAEAEVARLREALADECAQHLTFVEGTTAVVAVLQEALADQLDEHKHTWLAARAEVEGAGVSANLFEAELSTQRARALLRHHFDREHPTVVDLRGRLRRFEAKHAIVNGVWGSAGAPPPSPAGAQPTKATCASCFGSRLMELGSRLVPCTHCPRPCRQCASNNGTGAYCLEAACSCDCHRQSPAGASAVGLCTCGDPSCPACFAQPEEAKASGGREPCEVCRAIPVPAGVCAQDPRCVNYPAPKPAPARRWAVKLGDTLMRFGDQGRVAVYAIQSDAVKKAIDYLGTVVEVDENGKEVGDG